MKNPFKKLLSNVKVSSRYGAKGGSHSKHTGHEMSVTYKDLESLWNKQNGKCYWIGTDLSLDDLYIPHSPFAVSVDRLDSSKGYHIDNVVLTTRFFNRGRGSYNNNDLIPRLNKILNIN